MALSETTLQTILQGYEERRKAAEQRLRERKAYLYSRIPELQTIDQEIDSFGLRAMRSFLKGGDSRKAVNELRSRQIELNARKKELMHKAGVPDNYLEMEYTCPICKDTGYVHYEQCSCLKQRLIEQSFDQSGIRHVLERENFEHFDPSLFSDYPMEGERLTPRQNMNQIVRDVRSYLNDFERWKDMNILFCGSVGTGKTFLTNCIAKELMDRGYQVLYTSAYDLCNLLADRHFKDRTSPAEDQTYAYVYNCDLLIIDDLGTEYTNNVSSAELFHCINQRMIQGKGMLISTNLTLNKISEIYGDRLGSRIGNGFRVFRFYGPDLRNEKRRRLMK